MSSVVYNLNGTDKTLILDTRAPMIQGFKATNWTDLRLTFAFSVTKQSDPNDPTGLDELIGSGGDADQIYMGFKSNDALYPPATNFFGISTQLVTPGTAQTHLQDNPPSFSSLSTGRVGDFGHPIFISNGTSKLNNTPVYINGVCMQDSVQSLYASIVILQMIRNDPTLNLVNALNSIYTVFPNGGGYTANLPAYYSDTSTNNLRTLTAATTLTNVAGPFTFATLPNALYFYWPFLNSRLRIHNLLLEKYA